MATKRAKQLEQLAMSLPGQNQQIAQGQQQARQIQLQEQIKQAPGTAGPGFAQQLGAQQAQQAGQIQLGAQKRGQQQAQLAGQMGLEQKAREQRDTGFQQQLAINANQRQTADRLSNLDQRLKSQLLDNQLTFQKDQAGQTFLNERQLMDYAATKARSAEEYANYVQQVNQISQRELQMLQTAERKINQALQQGYIKKGKTLDRELQKELIEKKRILQKQIQDKQNKAANRASMFQAGGVVLGAAAGALAGPAVLGTAAVALAGPAVVGAMVGAQLGSGLGTTLAGATA